MATEDWRLCVDWLIRCRILPPDHRVVWPESQIFDFAQTLRDGVLLCHLLNILKPDCIDTKDFSQRPQMSQFLCMKNIRVFIQTCKTIFKLNNNDLFEPGDLFDMKDFRKVIHTLSKLSKSSEALKSITPGFPQSNKDIEDDADYYNTLEDLAKSLPELEEDLYGNYDTVYQDEEEDIYDDLCSIQRRESQQGTSTPHSQRDYCIKELVETEHNYLTALHMIITKFIRPMESQLPPEYHKTIFFKIEDLHAIHTSFHNKLANAAGNPTGLGDCFVKWKKKLLIYGDYCSNMPVAQDRVDDLCKRQQYQELIAKCQKEANDGKFRLRDLLHLPMQRVLKYHLLLKELNKKTDASHPDKKSIEKAVEEMEDLSWYVNEVKRDNETLALLADIQASIVDLQMPPNTELQDYGKLLKDGDLKVKFHGEKASKSRNIFLFNRVMLICKPREMMDKFLWGEAYNFKAALNLSNHRLEDLSANLPKSRNAPSNYSFLLVEKNNTSAYTFSAKTEDNKIKWMEAIRMALDNMQPQGSTNHGHHFVMKSFDVPQECHVCSKLLRGVFFQGYQCQLCMKGAHKECLTKTRECQKGDAPQLPPRRDSNISSRPSSVLNKPLGRCRALYAYNGITKPTDQRPIITFANNDIIQLLAKDDHDWWLGRIKDQEGFFPSSYVEELPNRRESMEPPSNGLNNFNGHVMRTPPPPVPNDNLELTNYPWYVGGLSREGATTRLEHEMSGTYLVRSSQNKSRLGEYALSIKFKSDVKHIKIVRSKDGMFYLADCKMFKSTPELIEYYQQNSLVTSFPELNTTLTIAYKDVNRKQAANSGSSQIIGYCKVHYDYSANLTNQLSLNKGDRVAIISKAGDYQGWWKGIHMGKTGYFPKAYVVEEEE